MNIRRPDYTGNTNYRTNWRGKMILQVEVRTPGNWPGDFDCYWKDATVTDYFNLEELKKEKK